MFLLSYQEAVIIIPHKDQAKFGGYCKVYTMFLYLDARATEGQLNTKEILKRTLVTIKLLFIIKLLFVTIKLLLMQR